MHRVQDPSVVKTENIGDGTTIWQFCVILRDVIIGADCNICSHVFIEDGVRIGDRSTVKNGSMLYRGLIVEDDVFIGPNVTFTNDKHPKSLRGGIKQEWTLSKTLVCKGASIGGGATILPGVTIGRNAVVGAGAIVVDDVPDGAVVVGIKARLLRTDASAGDSKNE